MLTSQSNDFSVEHVAARVHGRFLVRRGSGSHTLVGFHGYGQNAGKLMEELVAIPGLAAWTLVAVQALHPFYTRTQEVVANWMTRQDREHAIRDNVDYVSSVVSQVAPHGKVAFIGFSQGASMAWRAAAAIASVAVVALGGDLPPDVRESGAALPPSLIGRGARDDFYTDEKLNEDLSFLRRSTLVESIVFDGGHEWADEFRRAAGDFLSRI